MAIVRPADVLCPKWEPEKLGSKRCRYYMPPKEGQREALCALPDELLCVEWVRRYGTDEQKGALATPLTPPRGAPDPDAPAPLVLAHPEPAAPRPPVHLRTVSGDVQMAPPRPFEPAKEIDPSSLEALERAGVEVTLVAPHLDGGITLVPERTGRADRSEITFREAATLRLIVDCFPGAHVVAFHAAPREAVLVDDRDDRTPFDQLPFAGTWCGECGQPQRRSVGGLTCVNGHGGAASVASGEDALS